MKIPNLVSVFTILCATAQTLLAQGPPPPPPLQPLNPRPAPAGNAITTEKTQLGKALFWDEQLSSTRTISCGTCHQFSAGGSDPRSQLGLATSTNPGPDGVLGTADDITGSPGVVSNNEDGTYSLDDFFGMTRQVTGRYAPSAVNAGFPNALFWDGRAGQTFRDPITDDVILPAGAALESQAAGPPGSDVEMAHAGRNWSEIVERIQGSKPLALSEGIPAELTTFINDRNYPALFEDAFGDDEVTASRIIMAIATYERTLVSNDAPFDDFIANVPGALTAAEQRGLQIFNGQGRCATCHGGNRLTNDSFRYIGVRPQNEDIGREAVTGNVNDRGSMKVPGLRNVELKNEFMRNGRFGTLADVVAFYNRGGDFNAPNKDRNVRPLGLNAGQQADLVAFLSRPLTDQRLVDGTAPFDAPSLFAASENRATLGGATVAGNGNQIPQIVAIEPPLKGNPNFTVGVSNGLVGANATLIVDDAPIASGSIPDPDAVIFRFDVVLDGSDGFGSVPFAIPGDVDFDALTLNAKWFVEDGSAANGLAESATATFTIFGESAGEVSAPINLTASDATSETQIDVSWDAVEEAESYQIFRNDSLAGVSSTNTFTDTDVSAGDSFSYEVVTVTSTEASPKSAADNGSAATPTPVTPIPTNISATDGTDADKVVVSWNAVTGATGYTVFRSSTDNSATASQIGTTASVSYDDSTAVAGTVYHYFVKATDANATSGFSTSDSGFRNIGSAVNLDASDGVSTTHVSLNWDAVTGASSYTVYRGTSNVFAAASQLTTVGTNSHNDSTATPAEIYTYWVTATANGSETAESNANSGHVGIGSPAAFTATTDRTTDVMLNWSSVNGAVNYQITRNTTTSPTGPEATALGLHTGTHYIDASAVVGINYHYFIQAHGNNSISGNQIGPVAGLRAEEVIVVEPASDRVETPNTIATAPGETAADYEASSAGKYWGLLHDSSAPDGETTLLGKAGVKLTHSNRTGLAGVSLVIVYDGRTYRMRSSVDENGAINREFTKRDEARSIMTLALQLVDTDNGGKLVGTLTGDGSTTDFDLFHREYHSRNYPATNIAGRYTIILPSDPNADHSLIPGGDGIAWGAIKSNGIGRFGAYLGDGKKATITTLCGPDLELMFYRTIYSRSAAGFIGGKMAVRYIEGISDADGILQWKRGAYEKASRYAEGFDIQQPAVASTYVRPDTKLGELILDGFSADSPNATITLEGGGFGKDIGSNEIDWTTGNRFSLIAETIRVSGTANTKVGLIKGRYRDSATGQNFRYYAAAMQKQGLITGNFVGDDENGFVRIEPKTVVVD